MVRTGIESEYPLASVLTGIANRLFPEVDEFFWLDAMGAARLILCGLPGSIRRDYSGMV